MRKIVWSKRTDTEFWGWHINFEKTTSEDAADLRLTAEQVAEIAARGQAFRDAMSELNTARAAYEAAVSRKDKAKEDCIATDRRFVAQFQAIPDLDPYVFCALDVPKRHHSGPRSQASSPQGLLVDAHADGRVVLRYSRGENSESTVFSIEESRDLGRTWATIFSSMRTRVTLQGYEPGTQVWFRVFATRNNTVSPPTQPVVIWGAGRFLKAA